MSDTRGQGPESGPDEADSDGESEASSAFTSQLVSLQALAAELLAAESPAEVDAVVRRLARSIVGAEDARLVRGVPGDAVDAEAADPVEVDQVWIPIDGEDGQHDVLMVGFSSPTDLAPAEIELLRLEATMAVHSLDRLAAIEEERGRLERSEVLQRLALACADAREPSDLARALVDVLSDSGVASVEVSIASEYSGTVGLEGVDDDRDRLRDVVVDVDLDAAAGVDDDARMDDDPAGRDPTGPTGRLQVTIPGGSLLDPMHAEFWQAVVELTVDAVARVRRYAELEDLARNDPLTGLANRRVFDEYLRLALARLERGDDALAVFYVDLDGFKELNDRFGHHVGDELLVGVGTVLSDLLRPTDLAARLGGDEFGVLAEAIGGEAGARGLAERIRSSIATHVGAAIEHEVTASVGFAWTSRADEDPDELLARADAAMYADKRSRRTPGPGSPS